MPSSWRTEGHIVSVSVDGTDQLLTESRYIHRSPLAFVPMASLAAYRWSSLGPYLRRRGRPDWLRLDIIDGLIGDRDRHRSFVENAHPSTARRGRVRLGTDQAFARLRDRTMSQLFAA